MDIIKKLNEDIDIHKVKTQVKEHIIHHHKKYLIGGVGYLAVHFLIINIFFLKILFLKLALVALTMLGLYDRQTTFATAQTVCINNKNLVPFSSCVINFTSLKNAIEYLENKAGIDAADIYTPINYQILHETLNNYCSKTITTETNQLVKNIVKQKTSGLPQEKIKKLSALSTLFTTYKSNILEVQENTGITDDFCQKKYIAYALVSKTKQEFIDILDKADLRGTQNSIFESINRKNDTILGPFLDEQIALTKKLVSVQKADTTINKIIYDQYYRNNSYSKSIHEKVVELSTNVINESIQKLQERNILNASDIKALDKKINIQYTPNCKKTQGYTTVQESKVNNKRVAVNIQKINLNINICFNYQYMESLREYIENITIHELGHYVYYIKDSNPEAFAKLCRKNNKIACSKNEFVSKYAQTGPEEDYAESFLHRYLGDSATKMAYLGKYYSGNYYSGAYVPQTKNILAEKLRHFSILF